MIYPQDAYAALTCAGSLTRARPVSCEINGRQNEEAIPLLGTEVRVCRNNMKTILRSKALSRFDLLIFLLFRSPSASTLIGGFIRSPHNFT